MKFYRQPSNHRQTTVMTTPQNGYRHTVNPLYKGVTVKVTVAVTEGPKAMTKSNNAIRRFDNWSYGHASKQARYRLRNAAEGKCLDCPSRARHGQARCVSCRDRRRVSARKSSARRYANPTLRQELLRGRQKAYWHFRGLGYSSANAKQLASKGLMPDVSPAIPVWREPAVTAEEIIRQRNSWLYSQWERGIYRMKEIGDP